jgi:DNA-binding TFAR19-related protein (PDSD5 family)
MGDMVKFSSKMDREVLEALRAQAQEQNRTLAGILTEAARAYLDQVQLRPAFRSAVDEVLEEHDELLSRLAR